jgi:hypothetical protein
MNPTTRKVVAHADRVVLLDVKFIVNASGRQRVLREHRKNVHAFAVGEMIADSNNLNDVWQTVSYNPYQAGAFLDVRGQPIDEAPYTICGVDGRLYTPLHIH